MPVTDSPLRYPGGKSQLIPFIIELMRANDLFYGEYAEPFAGGSGVALRLLLNGYVDRIYINDYDDAIFAFWSSVLEKPTELCDLIYSVNVDIATWHKQRYAYFNRDDVSQLELGFATLFLNRTNRSGIIKAGVIGGLKQDGKYKLDCRFNKNDLVRKIKRISQRKDDIVLTNLDAVDFIEEVVPKTSRDTLINLDPPYFGKGPELYSNFYVAKDHKDLADRVANIDRKWIVTYDDVSDIRELYKTYQVYSNSLNYSAQVKRIGTELLVAKPGLVIPDGVGLTKIAV